MNAIIDMNLLAGISGGCAFDTEEPRFEEISFVTQQMNDFPETNPDADHLDEFNPHPFHITE